MACFGVEGHDHRARLLKTIFVGRCGPGVNSRFSDGLRAARAAHIAGELTIFEDKAIMLAQDLPGE